jgi:hypothetical protein
MCIQSPPFLIAGFSARILAVIQELSEERGIWERQR